MSSAPSNHSSESSCSLEEKNALTRLGALPLFFIFLPILSGLLPKTPANKSFKPITTITTGTKIFHAQENSIKPWLHRIRKTPIARQNRFPIFSRSRRSPAKAGIMMNRVYQPQKKISTSTTLKIFRAKIMPNKTKTAGRIIFFIQVVLFTSN